MIRITRYFFLFPLALTACHFTPSTIQKKEYAVINGQQTLEDEWIAQSTVALYDDYTGEVCSGVLIADNIVLTAAHCLGPKTESIFVLFGVNAASSPQEIRDVEDYRISTYWEARKYQKKNTGDIALVKFAGSLPPNYESVAMLTPEQRDLLTAESEIIVAGFGTSNAQSFYTEGKLQHTTLQIQDPQFSISEVLVDQSRGSAVCHGDSGGPAFIVHEDQAYVWGITSRSHNDDEGLCNQSAVFTSAVYYSTWIRRMVAELQSSLFQPLRSTQSLD